MIGPWWYLLAVWGAAAVGMAGVWCYCQRKRNAGYVDAAWALGIGAAVLVAAAVVPGEPARRWLVGVLAAAWAVRLGLHLWRRIHGKEEDGRYQAMRAYFGERAGLAFFVFFQMQAVFVVVFTAPVVAAIARPGALGWRDGLGVLIWAVALGGEALADHQLAAFKRDPGTAGQVCRRGLWRYSRHPNYFFEWVHWFTYLVIGGALGTALGWAALAGPAVMLGFLLVVTGVPYTEKRALASKGEAYRRYQRETSAFIPWFPRESRPA